MKYIVFIIPLFFFNHGWSQNDQSIENNAGIVFSGNWDFDIDYAQKNVRFVGDKIENKNIGKKSGTIKLTLYLTEKEYTGGELKGFILADYTLGQLDAGYCYRDIDKQVSFNSTPPDGTYYVTMGLLEYKNGYFVSDYLNFDTQLTMEYAKEGLNTLIGVLNLINEASDDRSVNDNEDDEGDENMEDDRTAIRNAGYSNATNVNNTSNHGHMENVTCSFCHGTKQNPGKEYPPQFGLGPSISKTRCEICGSWESHYHKTCPACNGRGYTQKYVP